MTNLLQRYEQMATKLEKPRSKVLGSFVHPDINELMEIETPTWGPRMRSISDPIAGYGLSSPFIPNSEPVVAPTSVTLAVAEANLYTPTITWASIPAGQIRAPQAIRIYASGIFSTTANGVTFTWGSRIGTSGTPASNASVGPTGALVPNAGATITTGFWQYESHCTIRSVGTSATAIASTNVMMSTTAGPGTAVVAGLAGNTTATFDSTIAQGWAVSVTGSNTSGSVQVTQFLMLAYD